MQGSDITNTSGLVFMMMDELAEKLNFSYVVVPPKDGVFGVRTSSGWTGMMKQIVDGVCREKTEFNVHFNFDYFLPL